MKRIILASLIALLTLEAPLLTVAKQYDWPKPPPLSKELSDYYKSQKKSILSIDNAASYLGGPQDIFPQEEDIIFHDIGGEDSETSDMARQYLLDYVIQPLTDEKKIELQDGRVLIFTELDRLSQAQLLYYYVRDHVIFPKEAKGGLSRIPVIGEIIPKVTSAAAYPCEVVARQEGECMGKTMVLAALFKLCGYDDVAVGFHPAFVLRSPPIPGVPRLIIIYHNYLFLKDEGWGIGRWKLGEDFLGEKMEGDWILLDSICSPEHVPDMKMVGPKEPKVLEFGDDPVWAEPFFDDQSKWGTDMFCWFLLDFE